MTRYFLVPFLGFCVAYSIALFLVADAAPPIRPQQPHPDIFQVQGVTNLQDFSTVTPIAKSTRRVTYRLATRSGCITGSVPSIMTRVEQEAQKVGLTLTRVDPGYMFTVWISCGTEHVSKCGGVNIFCLPDGFPNNNDVWLSDIISTYQPGSQLAIPLHEIIGHAIAVWNEQYCMVNDTAPQCQGLPLFASTPNWPDFMNTGPQSWHGITDIECERWQRTMWEDIPCAPPPSIECAFIGFDPCSGWIRYVDKLLQPIALDPNTNQWYLFNILEWSGCDALHPDVRFNYRLNISVNTNDAGIYTPEKYWSFMPACS